MRVRKCSPSTHSILTVPLADSFWGVVPTVALAAHGKGHPALGELGESRWRRIATGDPSDAPDPGGFLPLPVETVIEYTVTVLRHEPQRALAAKPRMRSGLSIKGRSSPTGP